MSSEVNKGTPAAASTARHLEDLILEGSLRPGDPLLPEREMALRLKVSRPTLRQGIKMLEDKGLITLDYDIPITGYDYAGYRESALFIQLEKAAREGGDKPGFLFDLPVMEGGSMALTEAGIKLLG